MITRDDIMHGLRSAGIQSGMTVFSHANIAFFGRVANAETMADLTKLLIGVFDEVLGPDGTLVLPVFTYSFGSDKIEKRFDLQNSMSATSGMGNWLITHGEGTRSADPMLSVVARGAKAVDITSKIDRTCFGPDSIWARLHAADAMICNLNLDSGSTFLHWVERELNVRYRSDIPMSGEIVDNGIATPATIVYTGRNLDEPLATASFEAFHQHCLNRQVSTVVGLGRGQIVSHPCRLARTTLEDLLSETPDILTLGHKRKSKDDL